ncbi:hypothetical protein [Hymenobacter mucosus]|uniref:Uncharacterized protein n=1 Tax=Hymenobacter mucosus TaxID=1411120 RepID=A0A239ACH9_9BACT|nr:hypothetical protein [Hymenobacter mucosus]SNR92754.1 hypothetical protein SAMN06269173_111119 [Hymenobacter mucosus]
MAFGDKQKKLLATGITLTARNNGITLLANAGFINLIALHD